MNYKNNHGVRGGLWLASGLAAFFLLALSVTASAQGKQSKLDAELPKDKTLEPHPALMEPLAAYELLLDVENLGNNHFVAVGGRGNILTSDDGLHWQQQKVPVRSVLTAVDFIDDKQGWAVGHDATILATKDGGKTWKIQLFKPKLETPFLDVLFVDANKGFAIGAYDLFYRTSDGGKTWVENEDPLSQGQWHLNSIAQLGDGTLVIAGETGLMSRSVDGGKTWNLIKGPYSGTYFGIKALGEHGALVYGLRGHAFVTNDVSKVPNIPNDTDLSYQFKKPPTMTDSGGSGGSSSGGDDSGASSGGSAADGQSGKAAAKTAEEVAAEKAAAERKIAEAEAAKSAWQLVENAPSVLSLFGATTTKAGGYVIVGINGVIWASDNHGPKVRMLPNTKDGGLSAVSETADGNLVLVGESGAYLYKRNQ